MISKLQQKLNLSMEQQWSASRQLRLLFLLFGLYGNSYNSFMTLSL